MTSPGLASPTGDPARNQSVLVTGAAGFVGSHLTEACLARGWRVTAVDAFTDYYGRALKEANAERLRDHDACEFVEGDLLELDIAALLEGVDVVFHLAAQPGVRASWGEGFAHYQRHNITAMQRLLEATRDASLHRFVFASSSSVYGDAETFPTPEDVILRPVSPYGVTKVTGEHLAQAYWRSYDVPVVTLRYFTVYGPRQRPDMAFHRLIQTVLHDKPFTVFGDGGQTRDFTYVQDAVTGTIAAGLLGEPGTAYNLGGGSQRPMTDVFASLAEIAGQPLRLTYTDKQLGDARNTSADVTRATRDLHFAPAWSFTDGLASQFEWQRRQAELLV